MADCLTNTTLFYIKVQFEMDYVYGLARGPLPFLTHVSVVSHTLWSIHLAASMVVFPL